MDINRAISGRTVVPRAAAVPATVTAAAGHPVRVTAPASVVSRPVSGHRRAAEPAAADHATAVPSHPFAIQARVVGVYLRKIFRGCNFSVTRLSVRLGE